MIEPPLCTDEPLRLRALRATNLLDTPLEERFERVTRLACRLLDVPIAVISLVDADRQWFKSIQGSDLVQTERRISFCGHAILQDGAMVVNDTREDERFRENPLVTGPSQIVFYAGYPVRATDGSKVATLCVMDRKVRSFGHEELEMLRDLAGLAETELQTSMLEGSQKELMQRLDEVARVSQVDSLTRVWNREAIFNLLEIELAKSREEGRGVAVLMADLDHFKPVNDEYGHQAGDAVLGMAAKRMLGSIRRGDALGRYGGEEFMVVVGACKSADHARRIAETMRFRIQDGAYDTGSGSVRLTVSVGVGYCQDATDLMGEELISAADAALYRAKESGRDRVEVSVLEKGKRRAA